MQLYAMALVLPWPKKHSFKLSDYPQPSDMLGKWESLSGGNWNYIIKFYSDVKMDPELFTQLD